jgi:hypothetical protein
MSAWHRERMLVSSAAALVAAALVALWTLYRAIVPRDSVLTVGVAAVSTSPGVPERMPLAAALIDEAVNHDLFHPERRRPSVPFRLPNEMAAAHPAPQSPNAPQATLHLLGTVVESGKDAFILCQLGNDAPKILRAGETFGGLTLRRIEPGLAVFTSPDGERLELHVMKMGS